MRRSRILALVLLVAAGIAIGWFLGRRTPGTPAPEALPPDGLPGVPVRTVEHRMTSTLCSDKVRGVLRLDFMAYLDADSEKAAMNRIVLLRDLKTLSKEGCDPLREVDALSSLIYEARPFEPPLDRKTVGKDADLRVDGESGATIVSGNVIGHFPFAFRLPARYPKDPKALATTPPFPTIVALPNADDARPVHEVGKRATGADAIRRRFPRGPDDPIAQGAIVFAPDPGESGFSRHGAIESDRVPLNAMWRRYHVDFDRIVIDGGSDALLFAAAHVTFYAGVIVRGDLADVDADVVRNFAHLDVYVVGTEKSRARRSLLAGGMPRSHVTVGDAAGIASWLDGVRRKTPLAFSWVVKDRNAQRFAHWVNVNEIDPQVATPRLRVGVEDASEGNLVRLEATGVRNLSLFLNDRIVDLSKPLRIVVNGREIDEARIMSNRPEGKAFTLPAVLPRSSDVTFDASKDLSVRHSRYYGFLFPVIVDGLQILSDADPEAARAPPSAEQRLRRDAEAERYLREAIESADAGDEKMATYLLKRAVALGDTPSRAAAKERLRALEAGR